MKKESSRLRRSGDKRSTLTCEFVSNHNRLHFDWILLVIIVFLNGSAHGSSIEQEIKIPEDLLMLPTQLQTESLGQNKATPFQLSDAENTSILAAIRLTKKSSSKEYWLQMQLLPGSPENSTNAIGTLYTSTGRSFTYESTKSTLQSSLLGPIDSQKRSKTATKTFKLEVNNDYLGLGLHRLHEFFKAVDRYRTHFPNAEQMSYTVRSTPFEDETDLFPKEVMEYAQLSEGSERAFVGALPALTEFFHIVYETDDLKDLLLELVPKRTILALLNPFSKTNIQFSYGETRVTVVDATSFELGITQLSHIPAVLSVGNKPLLNLHFYATEPSYEWKACAGIVALAVYSADNPDHHCMIRSFPQKMISNRVIDQQKETLKNHHQRTNNPESLNQHEN